MSTPASIRRRPAATPNLGADTSMAQREMVREAQQLADLSARCDQQLAPLKAPQAHQAIKAFMDEPIVLGGQLRAGAAD